VPRRIGWLTKAVAQVLAESEEPMRAQNVHQAVEALLGETVRWSSVKDCLSKHAAGQHPRFVRVARGRYALLSALPH
jgi:HB1, ASXL, restriction endonuclease HTH domain